MKDHAHDRRKIPLRASKADLEHALADGLGQLRPPLESAIELGPPLGEGAVAVGHRVSSRVAT